MESCFYILGVWGDLDRDYSRTFESFYNSIVSSSVVRPSNKHFIDAMRKFYRGMAHLPYYCACKGYLESFPVVCSIANQEKVEGLRRIWTGDMKYML
jgi:hypothetical protein